MNTYVDSGVLVKLYVREPNSPAAAQAVRALASVPITPIHELEMGNAFRALEGRRIVTAAQRAASEHMLERDIRLNRLRRITPDWSAVFRSADRLSREHTADTLARSLDILHVAVALIEHAESLLTADNRQAELARRAGLTTRLLE